MVKWLFWKPLAKILEAAEMAAEKVYNKIFVMRNYANRKAHEDECPF